MPPHIQLINAATGLPQGSIEIQMSGGEESAVFAIQIWNDKGGLLGDTSTAQSLRLAVFAFDGANYVGSGTPMLDGRWSRVTVTGLLNPAGVSMQEQFSAATPMGTNAQIILRDIPKNTARTIDFQVKPPATAGAFTTKFRIIVYGNENSTPLAELTVLATGAGVLAPDREASLRGLLRGSLPTADDTATVLFGRGQQAYDGVITTFVQQSLVFNLNDGASVAIAAGEGYLVTVSRNAAAALVVTKAAKAEAVLYPAVPVGNIFVCTLRVTSADGVAVSVAAASVSVAGLRYEGRLVRAGIGLHVIVSAGQGVTGSDQRQRTSSETLLEVVANAVNRMWRLATGGSVVTQSEAEPEPGADLEARVTTDAANVVSVEDARRPIHRAVAEWSHVLRWRGVLSQLAVPARSLDLCILDFDGELEAVDLDLTALDGTWTGGSIKIDVRFFEIGRAHV